MEEETPQGPGGGNFSDVQKLLDRFKLEMEQSVRIQMDHLMGLQRERINNDFMSKHDQLANLTERLRQQLRAVEAQIENGF